MENKRICSGPSKYSEQALTMRRQLLGEPNFVVVAQGASREKLKRLEVQLLTNLIRPGFRQLASQERERARKSDDRVRTN